MEAEARRRALPPPPGWQVAAQIALPAVGAIWDLAVHPTAARGIRVRSVGQERLELAGQVTDAAACRRALGRWLLRQAHVHLVPWLARLSRPMALPYTRSTVRLPRTRWGSCSRRGRIALSARLLLLPPPLAEYVLVHELCHTREPNHSPAFWGLVARHCPEYRRRRGALRAAGNQLPAWALELDWHRLA